MDGPIYRDEIVGCVIPLHSHVEYEIMQLLPCLIHFVVLKTFLCGSKKYCAVHGSVRALEAAKSNAEKYFPVIAVLEHFREDDDVPWRQISMLLQH